MEEASYLEDPVIPPPWEETAAWLQEVISKAPLPCTKALPRALDHPVPQTRMPRSGGGVVTY